MIAIIIVGFNNKKDILQCFSSIQKLTYKNYKIIFVDNHSQDGSLESIKKKYPEVVVIENKENYGFAKGSNIGIQKALDLGADYIFLLNPDTIVDKDCLRILRENADQKTILQPLILLYDKKKTNLVNTAGNFLHYLGFSYCGNYKEKAAKFDKKKEIPLASGAAMFIPAQIIKNIGFFDEKFFMYNEDVDFCWRARIAGYSIKLLPQAKIWHKYEFSKNKNKFFYVERNRLLFLVKNFQVKTLVLILPILLIHEFVGYLHSLKSGWFFSRLKVPWSFLTLLSDALKKRSQIQKKRKIPDCLLKKYWIAQIDFSEIEISDQKIYNSLMKGFWWTIRPFI